MMKDDNGGTEEQTSADEMPETVAEATPETPEDAPEAEAEVVEIDPAALRIQQLENELKQAQARLRAVSKAFTDQKEEMSAFRERVEARAKSAEGRHAHSVVKAFFEPVQNLKRSLNAGASDPDALVQGLKMILHQFEGALVKLGLEPVPGVGSTFDPSVHEALTMTPVADPEQDGKVLMVHLDGFMVSGKVIQAAQVVVGKHTPAPQPEPEPVVIDAEPVDEESEAAPVEDSEES